MHSHLLPGLDDGLTEKKETLYFAHQMQILGFEKLICTPHIMNGLYNNNPSKIKSVLSDIETAMCKSLRIEAGAEYMIDIEFERLLDAKSEILSWGKNYVLVEMSYMAMPPNFDKVIFKLLVNGYQPVLAHPERYCNFLRHIVEYESIKNKGCLLQLNLLSLSGYYGKHIKKISEELMKKKMIDFAGSDVHHHAHLTALQNMLYNKNLMQGLKDYPFLNGTL
jgi:Capsular polysaccharide biosynthesis protein